MPQAGQTAKKEKKSEGVGGWWKKGVSEKKKPLLPDLVPQCCHSHHCILRMPGQSELEAEEGWETGEVVVVGGSGGCFYSSTSLSVCESGSTEAQ